MCGGVAMTLGRSIVQEAAPASHRARVMSVYSLANFGGMPIGSLLLGFCAGALGPLDALLVPAACVLAVTVLVATATPLWRLETLEPRRARA